MNLSIKYYAVLFILLSIIFSSYDINAKEVKWKYYATGEDSTRHYYDPESAVPISGNVVRVWEKTTTSEASTSLTKELKTFREIDCSRRRYRILEMRVEFRDGSGKEQSFPNPKWVDITRNTWMDTLYEILCKGK